MKHLYYTGVGSRGTPKTQCEVLKALGSRLAHAHYTLRSGGAEGADTAFEDGAKQYLIRSPKQFYDIYLPWDGFEGRKKGLNYTVPEQVPAVIWEKAVQIAKSVHPDWNACSKGARTLHTRNVFQVLGHSLDDPSKFLICWAPVDRKGVPEGGTATAWRIAKEHNVRCFNINTTFDLFELSDFLLDLKVA
jgi:hypothetical protein